MDNNNSRKHLARIIFAILLFVFILSSIGLISSYIIYNILQNDGYVSQTNYYLLAYSITQGICTFLGFYNVCIVIISYCYYRCNDRSRDWSLNMIYSALSPCLIVFFIILAYGVSCVFAGLISYEFFAHNCTTTYTFFVPMLIFVILLLIIHGISVLSLAIFLVLSVCVIWPLRMCKYCMNRSGYSLLGQIGSV